MKLVFRRIERTLVLGLLPVFLYACSVDDLSGTPEEGDASDGAAGAGGSNRRDGAQGGSAGQGGNARLDGAADRALDATGRSDADDGDARADASRADASGDDGSAVDASITPDAGTTDATTADSRADGAGTPDTGVTPDVNATPDTGVTPDVNATPDTGVTPDASVVDSSIPEVGPPVDAGSDRDAGPPAWIAPQRIGHDDVASAAANFGPQVAVAANGDAMVVFSDDKRVFARRYVAATGSLDALFTVSDGGPQGMNVRVAMSDDGDAIVAWYGTGTGGDVVAVRQFSKSSETWAPVFTVDPSLSGWTHVVTGLAMTAAGDAVVSWKEGNGTIDRAFFRVASNPRTGRAWHTAQRFPDSSDVALSSTVAVAQIGQKLRVLAAWSQPDGRETGLDVFDARAAFYNYDLASNTGSAEGSVKLDNNVSLSTYVDAAGMDDQGRAVVLMHERNEFGASPSVLVNRYDGSWSGPTTLNPTLEATSPALSVSRSGDAVVTWRQCAPCSIWARRFDGSSWQAGQRISGAGDATPNYSSVALDGAGRAIATWTSSASSLETVMTANFAPGSGWGAERAFLNDPGTVGNTPAVGFGHLGTGLVAWVRKENVSSGKRKIQGAFYRY